MQYMTKNLNQAKKNYKRHNPYSPLLLGMSVIDIVMEVNI